MCSCTIKHIINELRKRDKMRGLMDILSLFCNEFKYFTRRFVKVSLVHIKNMALSLVAMFIDGSK